MVMNQTNLRDQLENLYQATLDDKVDLESEDGKKRWATILKRFLDHGDVEGREIAEKRFYEVAISKEQKLHDKDVGGSLGLTAAIFTLMNASVADYVSQWYESSLYKKVIKQKLGVV